MKRPSFFSKQLLFAMGGVLLLASLIFLTRFSRSFDPASSIFPTHAIAHGNVWQLEIANAPALRERGLGERDVLPENKGMLFLFDTPRVYGFWMKGMRFPLDIVFLSQGKVVFIERGIQPEDPKIVLPPGPVDQVLELNANQATGLSVGDRVWYWRSW